MYTCHLGPGPRSATLKPFNPNLCEMGNQESYPVPSQLPLAARLDVFKTRPSLAAIASLIKSGCDKRKVVLLTGAGVSVASGIGDFRSPNGKRYMLAIYCCI